MFLKTSRMFRIHVITLSGKVRANTPHGSEIAQELSNKGLLFEARMVTSNKTEISLHNPVPALAVNGYCGNY